MGRDEIEAMIVDQVKATVKAELPGLLRNVMSEIFAQKLLPKLTEHADARVQEAINHGLASRIQQEVRDELERLLAEE